MASIGSILSIARSAIAANQTAMSVTSHNIANADTEGYSRQSTQFTEGTPVQFPFGSLGTGVTIANIVRSRDAFLDTTFRNESADSSGASVRADLLGSVEEVLNEPSDSGLSATLDKFWSAWSDLANDPLSTSARSVLQQRGADVASMFNSFSSRLDALSNNAREQLTTTVAQVNRSLSAVAALNGQITAAEASGNQAPDLRDARDTLLDSLARAGVARADIQSDGTVSVYVGGTAVVSGNRSQTLQARVGSTGFEVAVVGSPDVLIGLGGTLGAVLQFINADVPAVQGQLDTLAKGIVNGVNEYQASGWTAAGDTLGGANWNPANGPTGSRVDFFDPAWTTAKTMRLSAAVAADSAVIAAGDTQNAPGNNTVALLLSSLREASGMSALQSRLGAGFASQIGLPAGVSYGDFYRQAVADLGLQASSAQTASATHETLASNADQRRLSVSGVSLDEELTKMMQYQQAYVAATRVIRAVDEMTRSLLEMV